MKIQKNPANAFGTGTKVGEIDRKRGLQIFAFGFGAMKRKLRKKI
jgi:hypothetical protein